MDQFNIRYPLLAQGLPEFESAAGSILTRTDEIKTDRGTVKEMIPLNLVESLNYFLGFTSGVTYTVQAGGADLLKDVPIDAYNYGSDFGNKRDDRIHTSLSDAQTITQTLDGSDPSGGGLIIVPTQLVLFYTTPSHERFLKNFNWKKGLGLKRRSYRLQIDAGAALGVFSTDNRIPSKNGTIIAVSFFTDATQIVARELFLSLEVNGITVIENLNCAYFQMASQLEPYIFKFQMEPGSTFKTSINYTGSIPITQETNTFTTFYFDN